MWMNAIKKIIMMKKNYLFIISVRREVEIENLYFKIFLKKLENFPNTIWNHKIFSNNLQTYNVTSISDLTISQNHSDIFFESISNNIMALSYTSKGINVDYLNNFFRNFKANNDKNFIKKFNFITSNKKKCLAEFKKMKTKIIQNKGKSRLKLLNILEKKINVKDTLKIY